MQLLEFDKFEENDLQKIYLFASSDKFSFSHIDSLVRSVSQNLFILLTPPGVYKDNIDVSLPVLNYGNKDEIKTFIQEGIMNKENIYNHPDNIINASSKVEFHKKCEGLDFIPKTVFSKEDAASLSFPIIAKSDTGSKGEGVDVFKTKEDLAKSNDHQVFCEKFDLKKEFRCLSIKGKIVFIAERIPMNDKANSLREEDIFDRKGTLDGRSSYKWETVEMGKNDLPDRIEFEKICKKINDILGLEFLGIDIGIDGKGKLWCIEANTCPGLNKDQIVLIYEEIFNDFYKREPNDLTKKKLNQYKEELMRANEDPAKFSFSPHMGRRFYFYDDYVDHETGERKGKALLTVKFDLEKSFGDPLSKIKKDLSMKENKILSFDRWINESVSTGNYSTEKMDAFVKEIANTMQWSGEDVPFNKKISLNIPSSRNSSRSCFSKEEALEQWEECKKLYAKDKNINWYVWDANVGGSFNKPKLIDKQRYDLDSILNIVKKYPDSVRYVTVGFDSDEQRSYGDMLSQEEYD